MREKIIAIMSVSFRQTSQLFKSRRLISIRLKKIAESVVDSKLFTRVWQATKLWVWRWKQNTIIHLPTQRQAPLCRWERLFVQVGLMCCTAIENYFLMSLQVFYNLQLTDLVVLVMNRVFIEMYSRNIRLLVHLPRFYPHFRFDARICVVEWFIIWNGAEKKKRFNSHSLLRDAPKELYGKRKITKFSLKCFLEVNV